MAVNFYDALISQSSQDKRQSIIKSCSYNFAGVWINLPIGYFSVCPAAQSSRGRHLSPSALQPEPRKGFGFPPALLLTYFSMLPDVGIRDKKINSINLPEPSAWWLQAGQAWAAPHSPGQIRPGTAPGCGRWMWDGLRWVWARYLQLLCCQQLASAAAGPFLKRSHLLLFSFKPMPTCRRDKAPAAERRAGFCPGSAKPNTRPCRQSRSQLADERSANPKALPKGSAQHHSSTCVTEQAQHLKFPQDFVSSLENAWKTNNQRRHRELFCIIKGRKTRESS